MERLKIRTYTELCQLKTFEERYRYLRIHESIGSKTFGIDRYLNQNFYGSPEWKSVRNQVILRDMGDSYPLDLGVKGHEILDRVYVHHMNPLMIEDISESSDYLFNPEYLICCSFNTHQAIHFGNEDLVIQNIVERKKDDQIPWR